MLPNLDHNFFNSDVPGPPPTLEFLLWSAYLDHHGIKDKLYYPNTTSMRLFNTQLQTDNH
jgi:hypothetical protein